MMDSGDSSFYDWEHTMDAESGQQKSYSQLFTLD